MAGVRTTCLQCGTQSKKVFFPSDFKLGRGKYCSVACRGKAWAKERPAEWRAAISRGAKVGHTKRDMTGANNANWKGGATRERLAFMARKEYKDWRIGVLLRDNRTCVFCGASGWRARIEVDHIKPYALFPELRLDPDNGRVLCHECHKGTDTYASGTVKMRSAAQCA